ncbi:MAG TPA: acetyl-CoA carboxylase biotin carboxylase subunit [Candidatus Acidoferrales bacterium]|nr:acetyl-CoA carboxylase biotin carboxylase subunit [Candidatus Acidoferrales bacterium]
MFKKILIANRGEIAVRVLRACHEMGIQGVAVYSEADRSSLHVRLADEAYAIGPAPSRESYLRIDKLMDVAREAGCDALHPGYGFLAENPDLPRACAKAGIVFIGPTPEAMENLGSKTAARQLARRAGVAAVPGALDPIAEPAEARRIAEEIGFPVLLKAVAGGGGKGMRLVPRMEELDAAWRDAGSEASNAFGDGRLYIEKYLLRPRHIEIQILGDLHGNLFYLGERECSVQRRHQKVIEEAPSPVVYPELRRKMGQAALALAREAGYTNAGTVEFLVDAERNFYFLEVNTRLQVEHPVTEAVSGLDLVQLQIRIASGERISFAWQELHPRGHAIECRIYAEDPDNNFFPSPGTILARRTASGPGVRMDEGVYPGWTVPMDYDPLLGKLIVWASSREEAIARMRRALDEYYVSGIKTNVDLFRRILADPEFARGEFHTRWLDEWLEKRHGAQGQAPGSEQEAQDAALMGALAWHFGTKGADDSQPATHAETSPSRWKLEGREEQVSRIPQR